MAIRCFPMGRRWMALAGMAILSGISMPALAQPDLSQPAVSEATTSMSPAGTVAYVIIESDVTDPEGSEAYQAAMLETLAAHSGQLAVNGGETDSRGGAPAQHISVIVFPSMAEARRWHESSAYQQLIPIRDAAETTRIFIVEGVTMIPQPGVAELPRDDQSQTPQPQGDPR